MLLTSDRDVKFNAGIIEFYSHSVLVFQTSNPIDVAGRPGTVHHTLLQKTPGVGNNI